MKKFISVIIISLASFAMINAQEHAFMKGTNAINVGIGVSSYFNPSFAISASYERGIYTFADKFTIGAEAAINIAPVKQVAFEASLGPTFHYCPNERFDIYAGPTIFFYTVGSFSRVGALGRLGVRYLFTNHIGVFANLGGIGLANAGVVFRF